ncbi:hypothetical protein ACFXOM_24835 [Streptomyces sp. NPDC059169]|uniref:hypothetical protein n=1 Tax=Streptomyces sp. NPDC059169 TaxID=3346754 RepID=UPI00368346FB
MPHPPAVTLAGSGRAARRRAGHDRSEPAQMAEAYGVFSRAAGTGALKVVLAGPRHDAVARPPEQHEQR